LSWPESAMWPIVAGGWRRQRGSTIPGQRGEGMGAAVVLITGATVLGAVIASVITEERDRWQRH